MARASLLFACFVAMLAACGPGTEQSSGADALMRIPGARFVRGGFPAPWDGDAGTTSDGSDGATDASVPPPSVNDLSSLNNSIRQGQRAKGLGGRASFNAMTVSIALDGDSGYWVVPVQSADVENPPDLDFACVTDFAATIPAGPRHIVFAAADADGRYGHASTLDVTFVSPLPDADLVVSLAWDQDVDLDLLVTLPSGDTLSARGVRTPLNAPVRMTNGPRIDLDSNANCQLDGVRTENAIFATATPGTYQVRVRMASACGLPETGWHVRILRHATVIADLSGVSFASGVDAPGGGPTGSGQVAATFAIGP